MRRRLGRRLVNLRKKLLEVNNSSGDRIVLFHKRKNDILKLVEEMATNYLKKAIDFDREASEAEAYALDWYKRYKETGEEQYLRRAKMYLDLSKEFREKATATHKLYITMLRIKSSIEITRSSEELNKLVDVVNDISRINIDAQYKVIDQILDKYMSKIHNIITRAPAPKIEEIEKEITKREELKVEDIKEIERELEELEKRKRKRVKEGVSEE